MESQTENLAMLMVAGFSEPSSKSSISQVTQCYRYQGGF
jgi:hypothetical protein